MRIAVDFDEVLFLLVSRMIEWHDNLFGTKLDYEDFRNYRFHEAFKTSNDIATRRYIDFALSDYSFETSPISNAYDVLVRRKQMNDQLFIASASQVEVVDSKKNRLLRHFPELFEDFHATNHYSLLGGRVRPKAEICADLAVDVIIDDNPMHLSDCAGIVKFPILFGDYPWNRGDFPQLIRAADWRDVEKILNTQFRA